MNKNLITRLVVASALLLSLAPNMVSGVAPKGFTPNPVPQDPPIQVPAGQRRCKDNPNRGLKNASVNDFVVSGHKVKFLFFGKPDNAPNFILISDSGPVQVSSYAKSINAQSHPSFFPGMFRTCARNDSAKLSTVSLTVSVDSN